ncbi:BatA domain-containing protein [Maribacter litopenaei]|uniref:BatA domain-containing protein n=1 Tax=Maribacter litopenaei TaxID=2976127 RepID=UPI003B848655
MAIPLIIHLLNKGDVKTVKVGSVKFLRESDTKQSRKIRLNELLLLFLRMLLLALIILYMAEPQWKRNVEKASLTYLIEPSLVDDETFMSFTDSLPQNNMRWFIEGFPEFEVEIDPKVNPNYWQLAQKLHEVHSDSIVVFTKGLVQGIKGTRPRISQKVHWIVVDNELEIDKYIAAKKVQDSVLLYKVSSSSLVTDLQKNVLSGNDEKIKLMTGDSLELEESGKTIKVPIVKNDTLKVTIAYDEYYQKEMQYFSASLEAVREYGMQEILLNRIDADAQFSEGRPMDLLIWLRNDKVPEIDLTTIAIKKDSLANTLLEKTESKNRYHLTGRLNIKNTIEENFTNELAKLLLEDDSLYQKMKGLDQRVMAEPELTTIVSNEGVDSQSFQSMDISPWIWLTIVLVLVLERILSKLKKQ